MIKYEMNQGHIGTLEIKGDLPELVADVAMLHQLVYEQMFQAGGEDCAKFYAKALRESLDRAEKLAETDKDEKFNIIASMLAKVFGLDPSIFEKGKSDKDKAKEYAEAEGLDEEEDE